MPGAWTTGERGHFLRTAFSRNNSLPLSPPATPLALPWPQPLLMFNPPDRTAGWGHHKGGVTRRRCPRGGDTSWHRGGPACPLPSAGTSVSPRAEPGPSSFAWGTRGQVATSHTELVPRELLASAPPGGSRMSHGVMLGTSRGVLGAGGKNKAQWGEKYRFLVSKQSWTLLPSKCKQHKQRQKCKH